MTYRYGGCEDRGLDDIPMLHGPKYEQPSLYEGSIHNDRSELGDLMATLEGIIPDSVGEDASRDVLDKIETIIGDTIDNGYKDALIHQIDVVVRKDDGLNVIVRDDSQSGAAVPEGVTHSNLLGLNTYYINVKSE